MFYITLLGGLKDRTTLPAGHNKKRMRVPDKHPHPGHRNLPHLCICGRLTGDGSPEV